MAAEPDADLFQTTRGKLLLSLCRGARTVNELMDELSLTDNAIRAQLQNLQDSGLVRPLGLRPGTRKPHVEYELTPNARRLFPQAHERVFLALMDVLHEQLPAQQTAALLKDVGRRVLVDWVGQLREREPRRRVAELYRRIVGVAAGVSLEQAPGRSTLRACGCPLASLTAAHPETCAALAAVLGEVLGTSVRDRCDRTDVPQCRFEIADG